MDETYIKHHKHPLKPVHCLTFASYGLSRQNKVYKINLFKFNKDNFLFIFSQTYSYGYMYAE